MPESIISLGANPFFFFYLPVNHRFVVITHTTNSETEGVCCDAQQMLDNACAAKIRGFILRAVLQMLVSVAGLLENAGGVGALTGSDKSPSHDLE